MARTPTPATSNPQSNLWPAAAVELRPLAELRANPRNARKHPEGQIVKLQGLMREYGWAQPVLVDEKGELIAGHGRVLAAGRLAEEGLEAFRLAPTMVARGWTEKQKRAFALADNKVALLSTWDNDVLSAELGYLQGAGLDVKGLGFSEAELFRALGNQAQDPNPTFDPTAGPAVTALGDVWVLGNHRIVCGDSTNPKVVEAVLAGAKPHLMVTDPPYGVKYDPKSRASCRAAGKVLNDDKADWTRAWQLFPGAVAYVWHSGVHASVVQESLRRAEFEIRAQIIWAKSSPILSRGHYHWAHEPLWYAVRPGGKSHWQGDRKQSTVWEIDVVTNDTGHGTQKPLECMVRPIINSSAKGDLVYEPFSGSGTTLIACEQFERRCLAVELEPAYVDVAIRRWQDLAKAQARLESTGQSWEEVAAERHRETPMAKPPRARKEKAA